MKRRLFLLGAGGVGTSLVAGTGAFTTFQSDRTLAIEVTGDEDLLVGLAPGEINPEYVSETDSGQIVIDFSSENLDGGLGANTAIRVDGLLTITNNGRSPSEVYVEFVPGDGWLPNGVFFPDQTSLPGSAFFAGTGDDTRPLVGEGNAVRLDSGESLQFGLWFVLGDAETGQYRGTIEIHAEDPEV